jgi:integrase
MGLSIAPKLNMKGIDNMAISKRSNSFEVLFTDGRTGRRVRKSFKTLREAETLDFYVKQGDWLQVDLISNLKPAVKGTYEATLQDALYGVWNQTWQFNKDGIKSRQRGQCALDYFGAETSLKSIDTRQIRVYTAHLQKENTNTTVNRKLSSLSLMLKWSMENDYTDRLVRVPRVKEEGTREIYLSDQQIQDIRQWMRREDKKLEEMFVIMLKTGLRTRNALHLSTYHIKGDMIVIPKEEMKNSKQHALPLMGEVKEFIQRRVLHATPDGRLYPYSYQAWYKRWNRMKAELGLPDELIPYVTRHTFASTLVSSGVPLFDTGKAMGHSSTVSTHRYAHLSPEALSRAFEVAMK